jgi:hypothetical protein
MDSATVRGIDAEIVSLDASSAWHGAGREHTMHAP